MGGREGGGKEEGGGRDVYFKIFDTVTDLCVCYLNSIKTMIGLWIPSQIS